MKEAADKRLRTKPISFEIGDLVLVKQQRTNKAMSSSSSSIDIKLG
jgi:hypothetical protein